MYSSYSLSLSLSLLISTENCSELDTGRGTNLCDHDGFVFVHPGFESRPGCIPPNGTFDRSYCQRIECPAIDPVSEIYELSFNTTEPFYINTAAIYTCRPGYESPPKTRLLRVCQSRQPPNSTVGFWSDLLLERTLYRSFFFPQSGLRDDEVDYCRPVECEALDAPANGSLVFTTREVGSRVEYKCDDGFQLEKGGTSTRVCLENRTWTGEEPVCQKKPEELPKINKTETTFGKNKTENLTTGKTLN